MPMNDAHRRLTPLAAGLGAAAVSAAIIAYKSRRAEARHPPRGAFMTVDGVRLHYLDRGLGAPLVLLHGMGVDATDFVASGLVDSASRRYRVIAFDRPGYGYSARPRGRAWTPREQAHLLHRALRRLGVEKAIVVGHSWGALVATAYAARYPDEVRSLVLASGYHRPSARLDALLFSLPAIPLVGDLMRYTVSPWIGRLLWPLLMKRMFGPGAAQRYAKRLPMWMMLRPSQLRATALESASVIPAAAGLMKEHSRLAVPVRIVAGGADRYVSTRWHSAWLRRRITGSAYHEIPGAGHMVQHSSPGDLMKVIDAAANDDRDRAPGSAAMTDAREAVEHLPSGGDVYRGLQR